MKIRKVGKYQTRHMVAREVPDATARALIKLGRYEEVEEEPKRRNATAPDPKPSSDLETLRDEARGMSIHVDMRWGAERLKKEIANRCASATAYVNALKDQAS